MKIKKNFLRVLCILFCSVISVQIRAHVLVFVHLGTTLPSYLEDAVWQASLFNDPNEIYVIANQKALEQPHKFGGVHIIPAETLQATERHVAFRKNSTLDKDFREAFWFYASERFLYLDDFMQQYDVKDLFHLESDNLLFVNLKDLLPIFQQKYPHIGAIFNNDWCCLPSFIYLAHKQAMAHLADLFAQTAGTGYLDMQVIGLYRHRYRSLIEHLPIVPPSYKDFYPLINSYGERPNNGEDYSKHSELFQSLFDGNAFGQYLGGIDPRNGFSIPGHVNESCVFNSSHLQYEFDIDSVGRLVPYALFKGERYRINNLHMHSKNLKLKQFLSIKIV